MSAVAARDTALARVAKRDTPVPQERTPERQLSFRVPSAWPHDDEDA